MDKRHPAIAQLYGKGTGSIPFIVTRTGVGHSIRDYQELSEIGAYPAIEFLNGLASRDRTAAMYRAGDLVGRVAMLSYAAHLLIGSAIARQGDNHMSCLVYSLTDLQDACRHLADLGLAWMPKSEASIQVDDCGQPTIGCFDDLVESAEIALKERVQSVAPSLAAVCLTSTCVLAPSDSN